MAVKIALVFIVDFIVLVVSRANKKFHTSKFQRVGNISTIKFEF